MVKNIRPVLFYDHTCPLCRMFVRFLYKLDKNGVFCVSPLQGSYASKILPADFTQDLRTVVLVEQDCQWIKSDAVLQIFKRIGWPWRFFALFGFLPKSLRDLVYQIIAKYRYNISRWAKGEEGSAPPFEEMEKLFKERFLQ